MKKYDYVSNFREGFALAKLNDKCGLINQEGEEIISPKYDLASDFSEGFAVVKLNDKYRLINKKVKKLYL